MTFDEQAAACRANGIGMSACLDLLNPLCPTGDPVARVVSGSGSSAVIEYTCRGAASPAKLAILEAERAKAASAGASRPLPWTLIGLALAGCGLAYLALRE